MKRSHAVGASCSFVVCQLSVLNCSTYATDDQVAANMRSCGFMRLTPFVKTCQHQIGCCAGRGRVLKLTRFLHPASQLFRIDGV